MFDSDRGNSWDLYAVSAHGGPLTRLTRSSADEEFPDWSPDGRLIAFSSGSFDELRGDLFVMNANGTGRTHIVLPVPAAIPDWQPLR